MHGSFDIEHNSTADRCTCLYASTCLNVFNLAVRLRFLATVFIFFWLNAEALMADNLTEALGCSRSLRVTCSKHGCSTVSVCLVTDLCDVGAAA